jgi:adenosylcobinamide amidohydrolase
VSTPETATLNSGTMATIAAAARAIYPYDASLDDVYARAKERRANAAREDHEAPGTIADAVMVVARGQRPALR